MKNAVQSVILGAALLSGTLQTHAAAAAKTNWVEAVNFTLLGWENGATKPVAISTKSILTALGHSGATAKLLFKQSGGNGTFLVREGNVDTDVTSHFVRDSGATRASSTNTTGTLTRLSVDGFHFSGTNLSFDTAGFTVETRSPQTKNGPVVTKTLDAKVAGDGVVGAGNTKNAVIEGTFALNGGKLE